MYNKDDYLMLSGIQHFAFCRRQWALIHIEQQWAENYQTTVLLVSLCINELTMNHLLKKEEIR